MACTKMAITRTLRNGISSSLLLNPTSRNRGCSQSRMDLAQRKGGRRGWRRKCWRRFPLRRNGTWICITWLDQELRHSRKRGHWKNSRKVRMGYSGLWEIEGTCKKGRLYRENRRRGWNRMRCEGNVTKDGWGGSVKVKSGINNVIALRNGILWVIGERRWWTIDIIKKMLMRGRLRSEGFFRMRDGRIGSRDPWWWWGDICEVENVKVGPHRRICWCDGNTREKVHGGKVSEKAREKSVRQLEWEGEVWSVCG